MSNRLSLADAIVAAANSGKMPAELTALDAVAAGATVANGTPVANIVDASTTHALNATFSDTEVEAALNALGTKINLIIAALEAFGIAASA